jgi:soluble lytic murein transglycosylase
MLARRDDNADALAAIEPAMAGGGPDALPPPGRLILAEALEAEGRAEEALAAYDSYVRAVPAMAGAVGLQRGQLQFVLGRYEEALADFRAAKATASGDARSLAALREGNALLRLGQVEAAVQAYREGSQIGTPGLARSQALAGEIGAELERDNLAAANALRLRLVQLQDQALALTALQRLKENDVPVPPLDEARVLSAQGDKAGAAVLLEAAIAGQAKHPPEWEQELAELYLALEQPEQALAVLATPAAADAALDSNAIAANLRARTLEKLGRVDEALAQYEAIEARWPKVSSARASAAHKRARLLLANGDMAGAARAYGEAAANEFQPEGVIWAKLRAGLAWWRAGRVDLAAEALRPPVTGAEAGDYWLGRAEEVLGNAEAAREAWRMAESEDPLGYYGRRAAERLGNESSAPASEFPGDGPAATGAWLAARPSFSTTIPWASARATAAASPVLARARALQDAGRPNSATSALLSGAHLPDINAALAWEAARLGATRAALLLADSTLQDGGGFASGAPAMGLGAPIAFQRLAYPTSAYGDLIRAAATEHGVPQDLLFAVVREESRFEPGVGSQVGATGLTQVMPETGQHLAGQLGLADFTVEDLKKPAVSLQLGAYFLGQQIADYDGKLAPALAAYNAGPGNAVRWWREAGGDEDLFVEIIDFPETSRYVKNVLASQALYGRLYPDLR